MARKLDRSDDQERLLSTDGAPPPARAPLSRRSYLGLGATTVASLTVTGASAGSLRRHGIEFDRTLDAVEDLGMDPTGVDAVDSQLKRAGDGTLVQFPEGSYKFGPGDVTLGADRVGLEGVGETVSFRGPDTGSVVLDATGTTTYLGDITLEDRGESAVDIRLRADRIGLQSIDRLQSPTEKRGPTATAGTDSLVVDGPGTGYEITVDGRIEAENKPPGYPSSGTNAEGVVDHDPVRYSVDGAITDLRLDGAGTVSLNGRKIDPARFGSGYPHELVFAPTDRESHCTFSVTALSPWGHHADGDAVTVPGSAGGRYRFDGAVESLSARGAVTLSFGEPGRP